MDFSRRLRSGIFIGVLILCAGSLLIATASQTTVLTANEDLSHYWRTTYDILVRPAGSRSPIEEKYGLVEANELSGIWGGITFDQYASIQSIPGVDVAAPIAMIGYVMGGVSGDEMPYPAQSGLYALDETVIVDDGVRQYTAPGYPSRWYLYFDRNPQQPPSDGRGYRYLDWLIVDDVSKSAAGGVSFPLLLAGIEPAQEAALTGLDQALLAGQYLRGDESLEPQFTISGPLEGVEVPHTEFPQKQMSMPVLINATTYISANDQATLSRVMLPPNISSAQDILNRGASYLDTLTRDTLNSSQMNSQDLYQRMIAAIAPQFFGSNQPALMVHFNLGIFESPGGLLYHEGATPFGYPGLALELQPPGPINPTWPQYRTSVGQVDFNVLFSWDPVGMFDIERLPQLADVNRVPLETYFPPVAILRYDKQGRPVNPPRELRPTLNPAGYIQTPPLMLTTLEAARALHGDDAISAIRVRVALDGCPPEQPESCTLTAADQRKIEAIAIQIQRQTGLDVDIMVGSSPTRILVHVPGIGYVEEQWIQKGVNLVYKQGIQTGSWLLLGTLLVAGGLFTLDLTWADVVARRRLIALQKALGWRSRTVFSQVMRQVVMFGAIAAIAGTLVALAAIHLLGWQFLPLGQIIGLPLIVIGLCGIGTLIPAWSASRVPPITGLQRGGIRYSRKHTNPNSSLWGYAWSEIKRRQARSVLTGLASALSAGLLTLLLGVTFQQRGMLSGTLLGEFILVRIEGYHYAIVAIGLGLAALSTFNSLMGSIFERRREIGVLKAVGWQTASVLRLFIMQGVLLGLVGGSVGALLGSLIFLYLYQSASSGLAVAILLGMSLSGLVGALAAIYPARLAAMVPPAEAVRYE